MEKELILDGGFEDQVKELKEFLEDVDDEGSQENYLL